MSSDPRLERLVHAYLDAQATAAETAELAQFVMGDPAAADVFARATRFEALLQAALVEERQARDWSVAAEPVVLAPRRRWPIVAACSAVAVAAVLLLVVRWRPSETNVVAAGHRITAGRVLVDGVEAETFFDGSHLEVLGASSAAIRLADGNDFELTPMSTAVIRGGASEAIVALGQGHGKFRGGAARRPLRVDTPLGAVSGRSADFAVDIEANDTTEDSVFESSLPAFLIVAVLAGQVEVQEADQKVKVSAGEQRTFTKEKIPIFAGTIVAAAADGKRLTLEGKPSKPGVPPERRELSIGPETKLAYFGVAVGGDRPTVGYSAIATFEKNAPTNVVAIEFGNKLPTLVGTVKEVSYDGRRLTIEIYRKGDAPLERTIMIGEKTRTKYYGIDAKPLKPTVGYQASVWLIGDSDQAADVRFAFKSKNSPVKNPSVKNPAETPKNSPSKKPPPDKTPAKPTKLGETPTAASKPGQKSETKPTEKSGEKPVEKKKPKPDAKEKDAKGNAKGLPKPIAWQTPNDDGRIAF